MSLTTRALPGLYNGVSQQPAILRAADQTEDEINTFATLAVGVEKRPPTQHIARVSDGLSAGAFIHHINRDSSERYIVIVEQGAIRVFDHATGAPLTVNAPGGLGYLDAPGGAYRAVTVADYTFIVNTTRVCSMDAAGADLVPDAGYAIWPNNFPPMTLGYLGGDDLFSGGAYQYPVNTNGATFLAGEVTSVEKLPENAPQGALYKVTGSTQASLVSFYVVRNGAVWDETVGPGLINAIDPATMPHALVRNADGTFSFAPFSWAPRRVGDLGANPPPSFIGRVIRDLFFYQNRLAICSDENTIFSCAGDFGNYWRSTVFDYIDSDVVDVATTSAKVSIIQFAVPFSSGALLFSDQTQFGLSNGENGVTPSSVAIRPVAHYPVNTKVRPVILGGEVYWCHDRAGSTVVREYARNADTDASTAADITAHVPSYVPSGATRLIGAPEINALFVLHGTADVYVYQFYWSGTDKVQSSWRKWKFDGNVIGGEFLDGQLYLLIQRPEGVFLERADLRAGAKPADAVHPVFLDRLARPTAASFSTDTGLTTFTLPYAPDQGTFQLVRLGSHPTRPGSLVDPSTYQWGPDGTVMTVPGDEAGSPCVGGQAYLMRFVFSRQFPLNFKGQPMTTGRLQLRTFTINYADAGFFKTEVQPYGTAMVADIESIVPAKQANFTGKIVGNADLKLNRPVLHTGSYSFQVYGDAAQAIIALSNDTHVGSSFVSAEWEGFFFSRAQ